MNLLFLYRSEENQLLSMRFGAKLIFCIFDVCLICVYVFEHLIYGLDFVWVVKGNLEGIKAYDVWKHSSAFDYTLIYCRQTKYSKIYILYSEYNSYFMGMRRNLISLENFKFETVRQVEEETGFYDLSTTIFQEWSPFCILKYWTKFAHYKNCPVNDKRPSHKLSGMNGFSMG